MLAQLVVVLCVGAFAADLRLRGFREATEKRLGTGGAPGPMKKILFAPNIVESYGARGLDGSPSGYYYQEGQDPTKVAFWLEGGGLCVEPVDCIRRSKEDLGSSVHWADTYTDTNNVLSDNPALNPFASWSHVYVPYCSGDVYIGTEKQKNPYGLFFAGHLQMETIVDHLLNTTRFSNATMVLLSGQSAGGIGTFQNADWLTETLKIKAPRAKVVASPQGGFYFPSTDIVLYPEFALGTMVPFAPFAASYLYDWFHNPFLDKSCMDDHKEDPHQCWNAVVHYKYITTPLFIVQNIFDSNQIGTILGLDWWPVKNATDATRFKQYFGSNMREGTKQVLSSPKKDGLFLVACYQHTDNLCTAGGSLIQNVSYAQALFDWVQNSSRFPHQLVEQCPGPDPCNPLCKC